MRVYSKTKCGRIAYKLVRQGYKLNDTIPTHEELQAFQEFANLHNFRGNEGWFLPEDKEYSKVLRFIEPNDVVLDIGAGNFALDFLLSERCKKVYAVEVNPTVVKDALDLIGMNLPRNLIIICGNGLDFPIPKDVNTLVMLLRHFSQTLPDEYLDVPKIIAQIYQTWIVVPNRRRLLETTEPSFAKEASPRKEAQP